MPSHYQSFSMHCATAEIGTGSPLGYCDALLAENRDLFIIRSMNTGSQHTEVHILPSATTYQSFTAHQATILPQNTGSVGAVSFALAPNNRDLFAVLTEYTNSGFVEVHVLSADANYQSYNLQKSIPIGLGTPLSIMVAGNRDLFAIRTTRVSDSDTKLKVELFILTATSNYQNLIVQMVTAFQPVEGDLIHFALASNRDLFMIREYRSGPTGPNATEVHILTAISAYTKFSLQTSTALRETGNFQYLLAHDRSLFAIKTRNAESRRVEVHVLPDSYTWESWLGRLPDTRPLSDINLPGTHDAASINTYFPTPTPWSCQNKTITEQLKLGIRVLDIRLKPKSTGNNSYKIVTCHGDHDAWVGLNEYQDFQSVVDECKHFLIAHDREAIVMILTVDDWQDAPDAEKQELARAALASILSADPTLFLKSKDLPTLGAARGKIVLFNRITEDLRFGTPIRWTGDTTGMYAETNTNRSYRVYVQDHWSNVYDQEKIDNVWAAIHEKKDNEVVLSFASAVKGLKLLGVYVNGRLLAKFGALNTANRPTKFGWVLCDFPFQVHSTDTFGPMHIAFLIIASNFEYDLCKETFTVPMPLPSYFP